MKVFFDTNVLLSAFISQGTCSDVFDHCLDEHDILISAYVFDEFKRVFRKKFKFTLSKVEAAEKFITQQLNFVPEGKLKVTVSRAPKDNPVLSSAYEAKTDCILTGDIDLLVLKKFKKIPIIPSIGFRKFESTFKD